MPESWWPVRVFEFIGERLRRLFRYFIPRPEHDFVGDVGVTDPVDPFPTELSIPPVSWRLSPSLVSHLGSLHADTGVDFARFAHATGVRFNDGTADRLVGIGDAVEAATIEAIADNEGRPLALWMRTAEPVDWRRVNGSLRIRHVTPATGCPYDYAKRHALQLDVDILPSPDGTSAFLVGKLAGKPTRLPRGEHRLTLSFDPKEPGLVELRPSPSMGPGPESVTHTFIFGGGEDWPLPSTGVVIPAGIFEHLALEDLIDPDDLWRIAEKIKPWDPDPGPWPGPVDVDVVQPVAGSGLADSEGDGVS